jgi:uncharacterized protein
MTLKLHHQSQAIIIGGILLSLILFLFLSLFLAPLLKLTNATSTLIFFISRLCYWFTLIMICLYSSKIERRDLLIWTEKKYSWKYYLKSIILTILILFATSLLTVIIFGLFNVDLRNNRMEELLQLLKGNKLLVLFTSLTAGVTEELIFRGYLMSRLNLLFKNNYIPIILSSFLFGIAHYGYESIPKIITVFFIGLVFALHYHFYRNIKILILIHFLLDFSIMALRTF